MANFEKIQRDFSGGEISGKLFMRDDLELHAKSVNTMLNFIPTLQGTAVRSPGTRFFSELSNLDMRLLPFFSQANERSLVIIAPASSAGADDGEMTILTNPADAVSNDTYSGSIQPTPFAPQLVWINISLNPGFRDGLKHWWVFPEPYTGTGGAQLGCTLVGNTVSMVCRDWQDSSEDPTATVSKTLTIPEDCTEIQFTPQYQYVDNLSGSDAKYKGTLAIGTAPFTSDVYLKEFDEDSFGIGTIWNTPIYESTMADGTTPMSFTAGQKLYFVFNIEAIKENTIPSTPVFSFFSLTFLTQQLREISSDVVGTVPYTADELPDLHYVQSPYANNTSGGKELVVVHPNHPPYWLKFAGSAYVFQPIPFTPTNHEYITQWQATGYPATCTSYNGRLILAGSKTYPDLGAPGSSGAETIWGTKVGEWTQFTDYTTQTEVFPDDSIDVTTIYRSPIQWVAGQKDMLIGAREMEYVVSADGVFQPSDIGVAMQSTHGSSNVQPVGVGETILFPAEGGTRVRSMNYQRDDDGYVAPDLTFMNPTLCASGVKRMVRMRNPHQMAVCVLGNGRLAILSYDPHVGVVGWSRIDLNAPIYDACVIPNSEGEDVLFVTVKRFIEGVEKLYLESFRDWVEGEYGDYVQSNVKKVIANDNVITGLDHLEKQNVQVVGDNNFLGTYKVESGQITLLNQIGDPLNVSEVLVGLQLTARLRTLPLVTQDPGGKKRYKDITVRGVFSTRAEINGERTLDRVPATLMGDSQPIDWFCDYKVSNMGFDEYQTITVVEYVPFRTEIIGIFGKVQVNSL